MAAFVLVHGAFARGWYLRPLAQRLRAAGHEAYTPTLTGLGERVHLASPEVGLETHIADVANVLVYEDLRDVVLVGKSLAGMTVTGVAERVPERLAHLVYLDAVVPRDGEAFLDLLDGATVAGLEAAARAAGDGWRLTVRNPAAAALPRTYVAATQRGEAGLMATIALGARRAREAGWAYREVPTGHEPERDAPDTVAALLLSLA